MKKLFATLLLAASVTLCGCGEASVSSAGMKANLEGKGYTAEVMSKTEAEARIEGVKWVVDIKDALYSSKGKEVILAFFCANIDDASNFVKENIQAMYNFAKRYTEDPKAGSHNNVAYVGTYDIVVAAGIPASK